MAEVDLAIEHIEEAPNQWPAYLAGTRRYLLRRFPFFVVYRQIVSGVEVVAIVHARRRPGYWLGR
jgi:toxin ParE1/3/4